MESKAWAGGHNHSARPRTLSKDSDATVTSAGTAASDVAALDAVVPVEVETGENKGAELLQAVTAPVFFSCFNAFNASELVALLGELNLRASRCAPQLALVDASRRSSSKNAPGRSGSKNVNTAVTARSVAKKSAPSHAGVSRFDCDYRQKGGTGFWKLDRCLRLQNDRGYAKSGMWNSVMTPIALRQLKKINDGVAYDVLHKAACLNYFASSRHEFGAKHTYNY